jgi:1-acyl-sn-glycerol-3-phosphate acyltransferase
MRALRILLRIILSPLSIIRLLLVVSLSTISLFISIIENAITGKKGKYKFIALRYWGKSMLCILGIIIRKNKRPPLDKFILMPNHRSYIDIFITAAYSPSTFVAKAEIANWPVIGRSFKHIRAILVKRDEIKSLIGTMRKIGESIDKGISITVFPEGTTSKGPGTKQFKNGTFKIASDLAIPIIPCAIAYKNPNLAWVGNDAFFSHFFREMWRPYSIAFLRFGEPLSHTDFETLKNKTKSSIDMMLKKIE